MDVALVLPIADEQRLVAGAARHGHRIVARCSGGEELAARIGAIRPEIVIAAAAPQYLSARLVGACDEYGVRLAVVAGAPAERRHAASLGLIEVLDGPAEWDRLLPREETVDEETRARPVILPAEPAGRGSSVIAVWGPGGAPGRTSLAIALAAELAASGARVALADADTHGASIAPALGLLDEAPGFAAACRLAAAGSLTSAEFARIAQPYRTGRGELQVLTGLGRPSRWPELGADRVDAVIAAARDWAEVLVIDTAASLEQDEELSSDLAAPRRNAATLAALRSADRVVAIGAADPVGLSRFLRAHADLLELTGPERVVTVVNKVRASAIGLDPAAQVRQTLARFGGIRDPLLVPWDPAAFDAAMLSGRPLADAAPRSAARLAIRDLGERLRPAQVDAAPRRRQRT